jgi:hypothetical protein
MEQIVLAWNKECEVELKGMGFEKREVYIKHAPGVTDGEAKRLGEREIFKMEHAPYQFCVTSYWGACPD